MMAKVVRVVTIVRVVGALTVRVVNLHIGLECNQCSSFFEEKNHQRWRSNTTHTVYIAYNA